ncbi:Bcr/CflA family drug resistance efflux transporter, partial [Streptomyces sp. NPDC037389]
MPERGPSIPHQSPDTTTTPAVPEPRTSSSARTAPTLPAARRISLLVTLILGSLTATPPLAMDMYLPALPEVTRSLSAPAATVP